MITIDWNKGIRRQEHFYSYNCDNGNLCIVYCGATATRQLFFCYHCDKSTAMICISSSFVPFETKKKSCYANNTYRLSVVCEFVCSPVHIKA